MSFKITWDVNQIMSALRACGAQAGSSYNDGFTAWGCKQDLIQVKYYLDDLLSNLPKFHGEEEYVRDLEKQQTWRKLKQR